MDGSAVRMYLDALDPDLASEGGTGLGAVLAQGAELLSAATDAADRVLVVFTDGEADDTLPEIVARAGERRIDPHRGFEVRCLERNEGEVEGVLEGGGVGAALAGEDAHASDHVNMGQSSNDVFPSAVHLAALDEATNRLFTLKVLSTPDRPGSAGGVFRRYDLADLAAKGIAVGGAGGPRSRW